MAQWLQLIDLVCDFVAHCVISGGRRHLCISARFLSRSSVATALLFAGLPAAAQSNWEIAAREFPGRILAAHNAERAAVGAAPLKWDSQLGIQAARYAVQLAVTRQFAHSAAASRAAAGENLWMGTRSAFGVEAMVAGWASEKGLFTPGIFPAVSRTRDWSQVGHYTQIVWPATQRVGCALASNAAEDYLVCHYWPAGNVRGVTLDVQPRMAALQSRR